MISKRLFHLLTLALCCNFFTNCTSTPKIVQTIQYAQVQQRFNECASKDTQLRFGARAENGIPGDVQSCYQKVVESLNDLESSQLEAGHHKANAYLLRGVSQWRIGDLEDARISAARGRGERELTPGSRDALFLELLPAQIANTEMMLAWHAHDKNINQATFPSLEAHFNRAAKALRATEREILPSSSGDAKRYIYSEKARILTNWETMINLSQLRETEQLAALNKAGNAFNDDKTLEDIIADAKAQAGTSSSTAQFTN